MDNKDFIYHSRKIKEDQINLVIAIGFVMSMFILNGLILIGIHPVFLVTLFILFWIIWFNYFLVKVTYILGDDGILEKLSGLFSWSRLKQEENFYAFTELKFFKIDYDLNRSFKKRNYIKLQFSKDRKLNIFSKTGEEDLDFENFKTGFELKIKALPNIKSTEVNKNSENKSIKNSENPIPQGNIREIPIEKPGFYKTRLAKVLAIFLIVLSAILGSILWYPESLGIESVKNYHIDKFLYIILPGTIYIGIRAFSNKK